MAQENAAMRAFIVCRNFSVNGGILARSGVVQMLPASEQSGRRRRSRDNLSTTSSSEDSESSSQSTCTDISMLSLSSISSSSSTTSTGLHSGKVLIYSDSDSSANLPITSTLSSAEEISTPKCPPISSTEIGILSQNFDTEQSIDVKQENKEVVMDLKRLQAREMPRQPSKLVDIEEEGTTDVSPITDEGCEYDFQQRNPRGAVKTHISASTTPSFVVPQMGQIIVEIDIFQYSTQADIADEGFWEERDDSEKFLHRYLPCPLLDQPSHAGANMEMEKHVINLVERSPISKAIHDQSGLDIGNAGRDCSDSLSSNRDTDTDNSESDDSGSQASLYQRLCGIKGRGEEDKKEFGPPILDPMMEKLVDRVMEEFWVIFGAVMFTDPESAGEIESLVDGDQVSTDGNNTTGTMTGFSSSYSSTSDQHARTGQHKRLREEQEEDNPNNQRKQQPPKQFPLPAAGLKTIRFACPFRKHDPRMYTVYSHRNCALSGWTTIARIK
jgi:hypothetical protein